MHRIGVGLAQSVGGADVALRWANHAAKTASSAATVVTVVSQILTGFGRTRHSTPGAQPDDVVAGTSRIVRPSPASAIRATRSHHRAERPHHMGREPSRPFLHVPAKRADSLGRPATVVDLSTPEGIAT